MMHNITPCIMQRFIIANLIMEHTSESNDLPYVILTLLPRSTASQREFSYRCNFCHFATKWKYAITAHLKQHMFKCSSCSYSTPMQHRLLEHQANQHDAPRPVPYNKLSLSEIDDHTLGATVLQNAIKPISESSLHK